MTCPLAWRLWRLAVECPYGASSSSPRPVRPRPPVSTSTQSHMLTPMCLRLFLGASELVALGCLSLGLALTGGLVLLSSDVHLFGDGTSRARDRECMVTGLRMMRPSLTSLRMVWRELALEISLTSLGSSQILRLPHPMTEAARRFCVRRLTLRSRPHKSAWSY
ncbi:hypothetical protein F5B17DRAFT_226398 [Nemania serpens]|nr:hypothetical protein F5B17DRAFT_226398 [Nemania serpens]